MKAENETKYWKSDFFLELAASASFLETNQNQVIRPLRYVFHLKNLHFNTEKNFLISKFKWMYQFGYRQCNLFMADVANNFFRSAYQARTFLNNNNRI